jgi:hypothetical protein
MASNVSLSLSFFALFCGACRRLPVPERSRRAAAAPRSSAASPRSAQLVEVTLVVAQYLSETGG